MKTSGSIVWLVFIFGTATLNGCGGNDTAAPRSEDTQGQALVVYGDEPAEAPSGAWGLCNTDWVCDEPAAGCRGWVDPAVCDAGEPCDIERVLISCFHTCEEDADCPALGGGDVTPVCGGEICVLPCTSAGACPDGFTCVPPLPNTEDCYVSPEGVCMQVQAPRQW